MTAADRPSVTDDARADAPRVAAIAALVSTVSGAKAAVDAEIELSDLLSTLRATTTPERRADAVRAMKLVVTAGMPSRAVIDAANRWAAGRAETSTATTEDVVDAARRVLAEMPGGPLRPIKAAEALDAHGLLATARTRPTREQIAQVVAKHDGKPAATTADAVLALLGDQPTEAEAGARALDSMAEFFETSAALGTGDRDLIAAAAVRERAARLRGGDRDE